MFLNAKQILTARDRQTVTVACPEWEGDVLIGVMGALDRAKIADWVNSQSAVEQVRPAEEEDDGTLSIMTCDSDAGKPEIISVNESEVEPGQEAEPAVKPEPKWSKEQNVQFQLRYLTACILDDKTFMPAFNLGQVEQLGHKNEDALARCYTAALELNADTKESADDLEKNSGTASPTSSEAEADE